MEEKGFHRDLKIIMDDFVGEVYKVTRDFPKEELYGLTSQLRRAALSVILNYIEGYARQRQAVFKNFLEISYGSLKETKYLLYFSYRQNYLSKKDFNNLSEKAEKIGAMIWGILRKL